MRGADRELAARELVDLLLELRDSLLEAGADLAETLRIELQALPLHRREHLDQRQFDLVQEPLQAELGDPLLLAGCQLVDEARLTGRVEQGLGLLAELELRVLGLLLLLHRHPGVGSELDQVVVAPGGIQEVGADHGVVRKLDCDPGCGRRGEQAVAAAAERLSVVGQHWPAGQCGGQRLQVGLAADDLLAVGCRPAGAGDGQRDRAFAELVDRALFRLDLQLLLDPASRDQLPLGQPLLEALHDRSQLELADELPQGAPVGDGAHHLPKVYARLDVELQRRQLLRDAGVVGVLDQVLLAFRARDLVDVGKHLLEGAELLQEGRGGLVADSRDAGNVVGGVSLQPDQVGDQLGRNSVALDYPVACRRRGCR